MKNWQKKGKMDYDDGGWKDSIQDWVYKERMKWTCTLLHATIIRLTNRWMNNRIYKHPSRMKNPEWMKWTERWWMYLNHSQKQGKGDISDVNPSAKTKDIFHSFFFFSNEGLITETSSSLYIPQWLETLNQCSVDSIHCSSSLLMQIDTSPSVED